MGKFKKTVAMLTLGTFIFGVAPAVLAATPAKTTAVNKTAVSAKTTASNKVPVKAVDKVKTTAPVKNVKPVRTDKIKVKTVKNPVKTTQSVSNKTKAKK